MLDIGGARDYAVVYVNGRQMAVLDRRRKEHQVRLRVDAASAQLDILVEDTGRINYGHQFPDDRKGLIFPVTFRGVLLHNWENYPLPMTTVSARKVKHWTDSDGNGPAFHTGTFNLAAVGDTYLNVSALGKGLLWVNGHAVGRIWNIGPQQSDYLPGCWLHKGANNVMVFDLDDEHHAQVSGRRHHLYATRTAHIRSNRAGMGPEGP
jgi:beta-galactosidase